MKIIEIQYFYLRIMKIIKILKFYVGNTKINKNNNMVLQRITKIIKNIESHWGIQKIMKIMKCYVIMRKIMKIIKLHTRILKSQNYYENIKNIENHKNPSDNQEKS